jgi:hypothetical protein
MESDVPVASNVHRNRWNEGMQRYIRHVSTTDGCGHCPFEMFINQDGLGQLSKIAQSLRKQQDHPDTYLSENIILAPIFRFEQISGQIPGAAFSCHHRTLHCKLSLSGPSANPAQKLMSTRQSLQTEGTN